MPNAILFNTIGLCCCQRTSTALVPLLAQVRRTSNTVDANNLDVFRMTNSEWMNEKSGAFKALHSLNRLRVPWVVSHFKSESMRFPLTGLSLLDVGCGAGLLSLALCRLGANVVGLDANEDVIQLASKVADTTLRAEQRPKVQFSCSTIEEFAATRSQSYDGVIASEVLEHVSDLPTFLSHCVDLTKPKSHLLFTTINKTLLSRVLAVWLAEDVFSVVPKGVHDWDHFVEPGVLRQILLDHNCHVGSPSGLLYNPLNDSWNWCPVTQVNYAMSAIRS